MQEIIRYKDNAVVDPVQDALADIKKGTPMQCRIGTGIMGMVTPCKDGITDLLDDLPVKQESGRICCTEFPTIPNKTTNDDLYSELYNQTIIDNLFPSLH